MKKKKKLLKRSSYLGKILIISIPLFYCLKKVLGSSWVEFSPQHHSSKFKKLCRTGITTSNLLLCCVSNNTVCLEIEKDSHIYAQVILANDIDVCTCDMNCRLKVNYQRLWETNTIIHISHNSRLKHNFSSIFFLFIKHQSPVLASGEYNGVCVCVCISSIKIAFVRSKPYRCILCMIQINGNA